MTKNIVIAIDATKRSLDPLAVGKLLADATAAPVVLLSVFGHDPLTDPDGEDLARLRDEARAILLELGQASGLHDADVEVVPGNMAARELQRVSERDTTGLLVVGSTSRGPLGRLLIGGVGDRLLTGAACPVAIAPNGYSEHPSSQLHRIGVAFDGSDESCEAVEAGRLLAHSSGGSLRVISVLERMSFGAQATPRSGGASVNDLMRTEPRRSLDDLLAEDHDGLTVEGRLLEGSAGDVLAEQSAELDLLVTGSRGYGPRAAVLLGSTTHALVRAAACPVLITPRGVSLRLSP